MKTKKQFIGMAIAIIAIAITAMTFIGCKDEPDDPPPPPPVAQSKTFSGIITADGGTVNVTVNYMALPNTVPSYMSTLETVIKNVLPSSTATGNLIINIIDTGNDGFVLTGNKTLSARDTWIANATEQEIGISLDTIHSSWIAGYSTPRTLSFGTPACQVTIKSDEQFTAAEWSTLCDKVVAAIERGYNKLNTPANQNGFKYTFANSKNTSIVLLKDATYDCEVKVNDYTTLYLKTSTLDTVDVQPAVWIMADAEPDSKYP